MFATMQTFAQTYTYDNMNRLTQVVYDNGTTITYTFDALGNRISKKVTGATSQTYTITTKVSPTGSGTVTGGGTYSKGTTVELNATANDGYMFSKWSDKVTDNPRTIIVNSDVTLTAEFVKIGDDAIAYAVYNNGTLTFYYDGNSATRSGEVYTDLVRKKAGDGWGVYRESIKNVEFNPSFSNARPKSTVHWFNGCKTLPTITGLNYLNTSEVTSMYAMFNGCRALTILDLRGFNTSKVTNMGYMFNSCSTLKTVYVSDSWTTDNVTNSENMFSGCTKIVGGDGTTFNPNKIDKTLAYAGTGGYLSLYGNTDIIELMETSIGDVYTLQGVHVGNDIEIKTLPKGIYIINGKKVVVK